MLQVSLMEFMVTDLKMIKLVYFGRLDRFGVRRADIRLWENQACEYIERSGSATNNRTFEARI